MSYPPISAPVRTAILGYGFAGRSFHAYLVGLVPGLRLMGIASRNPETRQRIEAEQGCRAYADQAEVFADPDIDLVILATPNSTHADQAVAALDAGKHVVTDKIMCLSLAECDRMLSSATANNRLLTVFQNRRFDGDFLTAKQVMKDGELGEVRWIEMAWQGLGAWGGWRGKAEMGGGRYFDLGAHLVDQLLQFFPEPVETVYCRMHHDFPSTDVESEALLIVTFAGGRTGICDLSGMTAHSKPRFLLKGDRATFAKYGLDPQERAMIGGDIDAAVNDPANDALVKDNRQEKRIPTIPGRWRNYYENIADVLTTGASPVVTQEEMRRVMTVIDAGLRSAKTGDVVRV
ncbi:MAG: Gfo/Idh/MocA family oxidoreductase [Capsulimonadales bacterium]|nr:Gfo/Idh/MocA family oxidoreductase [Capsulimonadales bacterium]